MPEASCACTSGPAVVVLQAFNPIIGRQRQVDLCRFETSLIYRLSCRITRLHKKQKNKKQKGTSVYSLTLCRKPIVY